MESFISNLDKILEIKIQNLKNKKGAKSNAPF